MELLTPTAEVTFPFTALARIPVMEPQATDTQTTVVAAAAAEPESPPTQWVAIPIPVTDPAMRPAVELAAILVMDVLLEAAACLAAVSSVTEPVVVDLAAVPVTELAAEVRMELDTDSAAERVALPMVMVAV
jgi:hypothetical protein